MHVLNDIADLRRLLDVHGPYRDAYGETAWELIWWLWWPHPIRVECSGELSLPKVLDSFRGVSATAAEDARDAVERLHREVLSVQLPATSFRSYASCARRLAEIRQHLLHHR